jgi:hypothetical protein
MPFMMSNEDNMLIFLDNIQLICCSSRLTNENFSSLQVVSACCDAKYEELMLQ